MFSKTRQFAAFSGGRQVASRLRDVNLSLVLVLVLIILPISGVSGLA